MGRGGFLERVALPLGEEGGQGCGPDAPGGGDGCTMYEPGCRTPRGWDGGSGTVTSGGAGDGLEGEDVVGQRGR